MTDIKHKTNTRKANILVLGVIVLIIISFMAFRQFNETSKYTPTDKARYTNIKLKRYISGTLIADKEVKIKSQISGILKKLHHKPGDTIQVGDLIAEVSILPNPQNIESAKNHLRRCQINFEQAQKEYARHKQLYSDKVIAEREFDKYVDAFRLNQEELASSKKQLQIIEKGYSQGQSNIPNFIRSTVSGTILEMPLKEGATVTERNNFNEGSTLASIANLQTLIFKAKVKENDIAYLYKGMSFNISVGAISNKELLATLTHITPKGFEENGIIQFDIEAKVVNSDNIQLYPGFSAVAKIILDSRDSVLTIKERNVIFSKDSTYVEILDNEFNKRKHAIQTGLSDGIRIEVINGLKRNEKIAIQ